MNAKKDLSNFIPRLIAVFIAVGLMIFGARYCAMTLNPRSGPVNVTVIVPETPLATPDASVPVSIGPVVIDSEVVEVECGPDGDVISAIMGVQITGGIPPYILEFDPSSTTVPNIQAGYIVRFTLEAGHSLTTKVKSNSVDGEPTGSKEVRAPSTHPNCDGPTPTSSPSATSTSTPVPLALASRTKRVQMEATGTLLVLVTPTNTRGSASNTPDSPVTKTNTPSSPPIKTNTPDSPPPITNTPNLPPTRTKTPFSPPHTWTAVPPSFAECEDGRDNDGDEMVDLQDEDCRGGNDNHEDR
jgi:hypothetical protein